MPNRSPARSPIVHNPLSPNFGNPQYTTPTPPQLDQPRKRRLNPKATYNFKKRLHQSKALLHGSDDEEEMPEEAAPAPGVRATPMKNRLRQRKVDRERAKALAALV